MRKWWVLGIFLFFVVSVNAAIVIDDNFNNLYSVGDNVELDFVLSGSGEVSDFSYVYLNCNGESVLIDKRYVFLDNEKKNFSLEFPLINEGDCQFEIEFLDTNSVSEEFEISENIDIIYELNNKFFYPFEVVRISGNATKANGRGYEGIVDFSIGGLISKSVESNEGEFVFEYEIRSDVKPGNYDLDIKIVEKGFDGEEINSGRVNEVVVIKSSPASIRISAPESVKPPFNVSFVFELLDQVGGLYLNDSMIVKMFDSDNKLIFQDSVNSSDVINYEFKGEYVRGSSYINAYYGGIFESLPIYVEDYRAVDVELYGNNLVFRNIGNIPYIGAVGFSLNNGDFVEEVLVNVSLGIGETYEYLLEYSGVYNISASGGRVFSNSYLTGLAIVEDFEFGYWSYVFSVLFFVVLIGIYFFFKRKKDKVVGIGSKVEGEGEAESMSDVGCRTSDKVSDGVDVGSEEKKIKVRKVKLMESDLKKSNVVKNNTFIIFMKSSSGISVYSDIVSKYGLTLNCVSDDLGYVLFYQNSSVSPGYRAFNIGKALIAFSKIKGDVLSVIVNQGYFEKKVDLLKKFALFNRRVLDLFPGKFVVGDKVIKNLKVSVDKVEKIVEVLGRKVRVWII